VSSKLFIVICVLITMASCSGDVAKETTDETGKDIIESVNKGVKNATQNIADAAPYLKEDITEGFWSALEALEVLIEGDSPENIPTPAQMRALQLQQGITSAVDRGVVNSAAKIRKENIKKAQNALKILDEIVRSEISHTAQPNDKSPAGSEPTTMKDMVKNARQLPSTKDIQAAWETLANLVDRPDTARALFSQIEKYIASLSDLNAKAGIAGPVSKEKIGKKAKEFFAKLKPGQVSETVKFMDGFLIVQLIDDTDDRVEAGYIYIPDKKDDKKDE